MFCCYAIFGGSYQKKSELPNFEKTVSYGYLMVATRTFELPFFRKSIGDDFYGVATKVPINFENPPGFLSF